MKRKKYDALILDVDGTIWDSTALVAKGWSRAAREYGIAKPVEAKDLKRLFGQTMDRIGAQLFPEVPDGEREALLHRCEALEEQVLEEDPCEICYPGVVETIRALSKEIPVCVVSNCQSGYIELMMRKTGTEDCIADTLCYGDTGEGKAANTRTLVQRNGFLRPAYVGDIQGDQDAAHEAGCAFIHAAYGFGEADAPEAVIASFPELLALVREED